MRARVLPPEEWEKVSDVPLLLNYSKPEDVRVVVVEDKEGRVVGQMVVLRIAHLEGAWIDPEHRNAGVVGALLKKTCETAQPWANKHVLAGAADENMVRILARIGAVHLPLQFYALGIGG